MRPSESSATGAPRRGLSLCYFSVGPLGVIAGTAVGECVSGGVDGALGVTLG